MLFLFKIIIFLDKFVLLFTLVLFDNDWFKFLPIILAVILSIAFLTLFERKVLASMQRRRGPNVVGWFGFLQAIADGVKLLSKETIIPSSANYLIFIGAPVITFTLSLFGWALIPFDDRVVIADVELGLIFLLAISSLNVYGVIMSGWASNSKYALLGALRSSAQMISYEVSMAICIMPVIFFTESTNLTTIVCEQYDIWNALPAFPSLILFIICILAETNRLPFDLPEAESELVSGYNVEYSSITFVFFFLAEYSYIIMMSSLIVVLFFGGWYPPYDWPIFEYVSGFVWFFLKLICILYFIIWVRATLPRYRYDQLMTIGWKVILPLSLGFLFLNIALVTFFLQFV